MPTPRRRSPTSRSFPLTEQQVEMPEIVQLPKVSNLERPCPARTSGVPVVHLRKINECGPSRTFDRLMSAK